MRAHEFISEARAAKEYPAQDIADVKYAYDAGHPYDEIATMLNMTKNDVNNILGREYPDRKRRAEHMSGALTTDDKVAMTLAFADGKNVATIANDMGIAPSLVLSVLKGELGDEIVDQEYTTRRTTPGTMVPRKVTPEMISVMRSEYLDGKSPQEISIKLDGVVSPSAVYYTLQKQDDWEDLRAKWKARRKARKQAAQKTTTIYRPGTIGNLRSKGPGSKHSYGRFSRYE